MLPVSRTQIHGEMPECLVLSANPARVLGYPPAVNTIF